MATHSNILAWRIPWTEESGGLQFIGLQRVRHERMKIDLKVTENKDGEGNGTPFQYSCLANPMDGGTW